MRSISEIVSDLERGEIDLLVAFSELNLKPCQGDVDLDLSRRKRCGLPEFIFGQGKTLGQLRGIVERLSAVGEPVLITRISLASGEALATEFPDSIHDPQPGIFLLPGKKSAKSAKGMVIIAAAGTTDMPVALEAKYTLDACGCGCQMIPDCGVAGLGRLLARTSLLRKADVVIAVAGMEGALPSVVGGLVSCPVIAVPTSVGYGASLGGLAALLSMLNSCASGVTVTNIDNGFGAACAAARIINSKAKAQLEKLRTPEPAAHDPTARPPSLPKT